MWSDFEGGGAWARTRLSDESFLSGKLPDLTMSNLSYIEAKMVCKSE